MKKGEIFPIYGFIKFKGKFLRVLGINFKGLLVEVPEDFPLEVGKVIRSVFMLPFNGYGKVVINNLKLKCEGFEKENSLNAIFCSFVKLSEVEKEFFDFLIRSFLWRNILSDEDIFMNYTQDKNTEKAIIRFQKELSSQSRLKYALASIVLIFAFLGLLVYYFSNLRTLEEKTPLVFKCVEPGVSNKLKKEEGAPSSKSFDEAKENKTERVAYLGGNSTDKKENGTERVASLLNDNSTTNKENDTEKVAYLTENSTGNFSQPLSSENETDNKLGLDSQRSYYCIQVASSKSEKDLIKLAQKLEDYPFVRVEKIGSLYTLRVGFWESSKDASLILRSLKEKFRGPFLRICDYKPERWTYANR